MIAVRPEISKVELPTTALVRIYGAVTVIEDTMPRLTMSLPSASIVETAGKYAHSTIEDMLLGAAVM